MIELVLNAIIPLISMVIGYYVLSKKIENLIKTKEIEYKNAVEMWLNSETGQKALYQIGGLVGSGVGAGIGLKKGSGKMKWEDLLMQLAGNFLSGNVKLGPGAVTPSPSATPSPVSKALPSA